MYRNNPVLFNDILGNIPWGQIIKGYNFKKPSSPFGTRIDPVYKTIKKHNGIDYSVSLKSEIQSAARGTVTFAGAKKGYGNMVIIDHGDGYITRYAHMKASDIKVKVGDIVYNGQTLALVGNEGKSTGPHLHFEIIKDNEYIDPTSIPDLDEEIWGVPEGLEGDEIIKFKMLIDKKERLEFRKEWVTFREFCGMNKDKTKRKNETIDEKLSNLNIEINSLRKTANKRTWIKNYKEQLGIIKPQKNDKDSH